MELDVLMNGELAGTLIYTAQTHRLSSGRTSRTLAHYRSAR